MLNLSHSSISIIIVPVDRASLVAQTVKNLPAMWETQIRSVDGEDPPEQGNGNPLQYSHLENSFLKKYIFVFIYFFDCIGS